MARLSYAVLFSFAALALVACGSKSSSGTPDAVAVTVTDAKPPDAAPPDAFSCAAPLMECVTGACTNTDTDEANCGTCGMACKGGQACTTHTCACPTPQNFLGDSIVSSPLDQFINQSIFQIGVGPASAGTGLNALLVGVQTGNGGTATKKDYTLTAPSGGGIPSFPLIAALYGIDISNGASADATYAAISGTVSFSALTHVTTAPACDQITGTLTNVTFQGATGSLTSGSIAVDPEGCTFTVATLPFDIKSGAGCP